MSTTHKFGCNCGRCGPPEPPPMRIGQEGDTIDRAGVRRKADGTLRKGPRTAKVIGWCTVAGWIWVTLGVLFVASRL